MSGKHHQYSTIAAGRVFDVCGHQSNEGKADPLLGCYGRIDE